ncbi:MAG: sensor histidine kinase N-terminal domain-containing protein, partial [Proteobacteria bacterium]|nr:sensor histidine kinase N-terminal domain-containing protein [Pseudomonadota bacterium]
MLSSLRLRLAAWLLLPLSLFVAVSAWFSWRNAAEVADYVQDRDLLASAKVLAGRLIWEGDEVQASVPPAALSLFLSPAHDQVFLSVTSADGALLAGMPGFPLPARRSLRGPDRAQWYDARFEGRPVRAVLTERSMYDVAGAREITIAVAKTTGSRDQMVRTLWWPTLRYLLIALVLAIALTTLALTWELRPLVRLGRQLALRDPLHLDFAVDTHALHSELRPVGETINQFVRQLKKHSDAQRRFIADAAHQLRTPLALQASQIEFARYAREHRKNWETRRADMDALWREMQESNHRLIAVTNKLLLLAQAEHGDAQARLVPVDLGAAALRSVEQLAALADRRHIDLGFDAAPHAPAIVRAEPALLDALIANLVDNALRYTQEGGRVTVAVRRVGAQVELAVEDNGPGIPAEAEQRVFDRFYRISNDAEGTGLGLAIVQEVARTCGASVQLGANPREPHGLLVTV